MIDDVIVVNSPYVDLKRKAIEWATKSYPDSYDQYIIYEEVQWAHYHHDISDVQYDDLMNWLFPADA
jgi:hypothetical protein